MTRSEAMPREQVPRGLGDRRGPSARPGRCCAAVSREKRASFRRDVVIGREAVDADHLMAIAQEPLGHMEADEARPRR